MNTIEIKCRACGTLWIAPKAGCPNAACSIHGKNQAVTDSEFFIAETMAEPLAVKLANEIVDAAKRQYPVGPYAKAAQLQSLIAELTLQNVILSLLLAGHEPGSKEAEDAIRLQYGRYTEGAVKRWHQPDLKEYRAKGLI